MKMGFYISISGIATFKNAAALQEVVKALPWERLLVETDSPYLALFPTGGGKRTGFRSGRCPVYRRSSPDPCFPSWLKPPAAISSNYSSWRRNNPKQP